jgi:Ran GTPase-activating protein (RanGAP) involved in mRNA processing and transport
LEELELDLYFNNIAEAGTQSIAKTLKKLTNLHTLVLNLDFNYIKNEGAKALGQALKEMKNLR